MRLLFVEVAFYSVENAVNKLCRFVSREPARDFERFVDCDGAWRRLLQKFVDSEAKDVAIDDSHARDTPVFGARADALVE